MDSGDPQETQEALTLIGFLDGQTTNPSLIAKNPNAAGKKFSAAEILNFYEKVVKEVSAAIPQGSVSIEVYSDKHTSAEEMMAQAREFYKWIANAHIKFPTTIEGLKAAEISIKEGMRVNMTLVFSQQQAAAVYAATRGAVKGQVFLSPFIGRLDDIGQNGMDLIQNIITMYKSGDGHVEVLAASIRSLDHFMESLHLGADIMTVPMKVLKMWAAQSMPTDIPNLKYELPNSTPIKYQEIDLNKPWQDYDIRHELTDIGIEKFSADWNALIGHN